MKKKYQNSDSGMRDEYKRLNKKLILPNIVIAVIAIIALYFQLFTPFLKLNLHITGDAVTSLVSTVASDDSEESDEDSLLSALTDPDVIASATSDLDVTIAIQVTPMQLMAVGSASDEAVKDEIINLVAEVITDLDIKQTVEEILQSVVPSVAGAVLTDMIKSSADGLTDEQAAIIDSCSDSISEALTMLADGDEEGAKDKLLTSVEDSMREAGYSEEDISSISADVEKYFDDLVACSTDGDGNFSYLTMLDNLDELLDRLGTSSDDGEETTASAVKYTLTETTTTDESEETSAISEYLNLLDDPEALAEELLGESLDSDTLLMVRTVMLALFGLIAFVAGLWGLLALLALLHILLKNKKVGMWYVKLFGGLIAVIFYLLPNVVLLVVKYSSSILGELGTTASTLVGLISFGGSGLAVLICLLALWLVSIFWCHPIKKKIKRCKRAMKG